MGFTPFPYVIRLEAVEYAYGRIAVDADLIAHHFDNGVSWVEALSGEPYSDNIINDWKFRLANTPETHQERLMLDVWRAALLLPVVPPQS